MFRQPPGLRTWLPLILALGAASSVVPRASEPGLRGQLAPSTAAVIPIDISVFDRAGAFVDNLTPENFSVAVDGQRRRLFWLRHISRGPGSSAEASRRRAGRADSVVFAAEPARNVLVVIDESSLPRGSEKAVVDAAAALLDRLGLGDRVGVVRMPAFGETVVPLATDRPDVRVALRRIVGRAYPTAVSGASPSAPPPQPDGPAVPSRVTVDAGQNSAAASMSSGFLPGFQVFLNTLRSIPGRKTLVVFSAGLPSDATRQFNQLIVAAGAANATIHALAFLGPRDDTAGAIDPVILERLATSTGGSYTELRKGWQKSIDGLVSDLAACYVLGIEGAPSDADGGLHALRVEIAPQRLTIRAPTLLVRGVDTGDVEAADPAAALQPGSTVTATAANAAAVARTSSSGAVPAPASDRGVEVQRAVARAVEYVEAYQREYSLLVAEEHFIQTYMGRKRELRSDLLLVRTDGEEGWVSFRDVFEFDGRPVRDREDRLKRLFLDPSAEAQAKLGAIKNESARYNVGAIGRNINVPLFTLKFLEAENVRRFRFSQAGRKDVEGVAASRISYEEESRPTVVSLNKTTDIAARGWFLVDPASGAVLGSRMEFELGSFGESAVLEVRYTRDATLGLWVPSEMTEVYVALVPPRTLRVSLDARATYSKFRRFQVTTDHQITIPK